MSRKKIIWLIVLVAVAAGGLYAYKEYSRTHRDLAKVKADFRLEAVQLIADFEGSEGDATKKYNGKVLEVTGTVKVAEVDERGFYTVVLGKEGELSSVRCAIDSVHSADASQLKAGSSQIVRGICTGFNKDDMGLGSDVILNRCVIVKKKD